MRGKWSAGRFVVRLLPIRENPAHCHPIQLEPSCGLAPIFLMKIPLCTALTSDGDGSKKNWPEDGIDDVTTALQFRLMFEMIDISSGRLVIRNNAKRSSSSAIIIERALMNDTARGQGIRSTSCSYFQG